MKRFFRAVAVSVGLVGLVTGCAAPGGSNSPKAPAAGPTVPVAPSQRTVGDILAKGGKQLSASEMRNLIPGAKWTTMGERGSYTLTNLPSGDFEGVSEGGRKFTGQWYVDPQGRHCGVLRRGNDSSSAGPDCTYFYLLAGEHFVSKGTEPSSPASTRVVVK